ncbi:hypothetical protein D9M68_943980 [compost metagenome]
MLGRRVPALLRQLEDFAYGRAAQALAALDHGARRDQRTLPREHDVQAADDIPGRHAAKQGQADHTPDHRLQRQAPLAKSGDPRRLERGLDQFRIE